MRAFASDNYAGAHAEVLAAVAEANRDHAVGYGDDPWTARATELIRSALGDHAESFLVFNGTAANVLCLETCCRPWESVITPLSSHLHVDEAGAPERMAGLKTLVVPTADGKLRPQDLPPLLERRGDQHATQPRVVSVANATELGTVYAVDELRTLVEAAHALDLLVHVDGARLANACAATGVSPRELVTDLGVDVLSLGLTKAGALGVEAVVVLRPDLADGMAWRRKQQGQLSSKMRFLAAQVIAMLEDDLWLRAAAHANAMAARLAGAVRAIEGVEITRPVEASAVFARLPSLEATEAVRARFAFYDWDGGEVRWMCSWDTGQDEVDAFADAVRDAVRA